VYSAVLKEILSGEATEYVVSNIHNYLTTLGETVRTGSMPIDEFIIFKVGHFTGTDELRMLMKSDWERTQKTTQTRSLNRTSRLL
jgi:hypothetical protein